MSDTARLAPLFPTPVFSQVLPGHEALDRELAEIILARRAAERGVTISNVGGWQSANDMLRWGGAAAHRLAASAIAVADAATVPVPGATRPVWQPEMWANVNDPGDSNQTHWHPGSYLSAVYYVDNGYGGAANPEFGGELVFLDPRMPYLHMRTPDLYHRAANGSTAGQETWVRPVPGLLILFPSWLGHSVRPYRGSARRLTVAINLVARPAAA